MESQSSISDMVAQAASQQNPKSLDLCANCSNLSEKVGGFLRCASCKKTAYCSKECQKKHWKVHKFRCLTLMKNPEDSNYAMLEKWKNDYKTNLYKIFRGVLVRDGMDYSRTHFAVVVVDYVAENRDAPFQIVSYKSYGDDEPVSELGRISGQIQLVRNTNNIPCDENNQFEIGILHCRGLPGYTGDRNLIKVMPMNSRNMSTRENIPVESYVALINAGNALKKFTTTNEAENETKLAEDLIEHLKQEAASICGMAGSLQIRQRIDELSANLVTSTGVKININNKSSNSNSNSSTAENRVSPSTTPVTTVASTTVSSTTTSTTNANATTIVSTNVSSTAGTSSTTSSSNNNNNTSTSSGTESESRKVHLKRGDGDVVVGCSCCNPSFVPGSSSSGNNNRYRGTAVSSE